MKQPEIPINESERLQALRELHILDTAFEERFDQLTRMAKRLFSVPIALVSLVDENRQWFKSCIGLDTRETSRDISFCGHAILGDDIFEIPDASQDERFADNPLVVDEPNIRFYAGCPLTVNGHRLGTLCLIDEIPRLLTPADRQLFRDLANMAERELEAVQAATLDELTGLSNRRGFRELASHMLRLSHREQFPSTLAFIDLNNFKTINDTYGHAEGDRALKYFAQLLQETFRDSDLIARFGGDEFIILLSHASSIQAELAVSNFVQRLSERKPMDTEYELSCSCGIVTYNPDVHRTIDDLLNDGDRLMYENKHSEG